MGSLGRLLVWKSSLGVNGEPRSAELVGGHVPAWGSLAAWRGVKSLNSSPEKLGAALGASHGRFPVPSLYHYLLP
jgi:hypothetical protein